MSKIDLSIIIVSYNTKDLTVDAVKSIKQNSDDISYEVIVVDNASKDGSVDALFELSKEKKYNLTFIPNPTNDGFSKGNNIGIEKSKGEYILFLNSDTLLRKNTLKGMLTFMKKNLDVGASTCKLIMENGELDDATHRGFPTPWRSFCHFTALSKIFPHSRLFAGYQLGWMDLNKTHEIEALAGAFMIVPRAAGEQGGWWDEDYFFYGEDIQFCYDLKKKGWKIMFVADFSILHYKGASGGIKKNSNNITKATKETKKRVINSRFNAMKIFYKKNYEKSYPIILKYIIFSAVDLKWAYSRLKLWL